MLSPYQLLSLECILAPKVRGIPDLDLTIVNPEVNRFFRFALEHQVMETGEGKLRRKEATHVGAAHNAGHRGFAADMSSS